MATASGTVLRPKLCAFLDAVGSSGVLSEEQLDHLATGLPASVVSTDDAARWAISEGLLTRYQVDRLLAGKGDGLVLEAYTILEPLGQSTVGRAFKARHRAMDKLVVVKVLAPHVTKTEADIDALEAEARAAAQLAHPHVVTVLDVNSVGRRHYMVRDYVDGTAADAVVQQNGPMPVSLACDVVRQAALGLQHAHEKGIAHGTVGPANVIIGWENTGPAVKVTNFTLGRFTGITAGAAPAGQGADPADYRAPEQGATPTVAADLYALGAMLHFLLTGTPPFPGGTAAEKAERHWMAVPPDVRTLVPGVPPAVADLIRSLLAKHPAHRPGTAAEVAARLQPYVEAGAHPPPQPVVPMATPFPGVPAISMLLPLNPWTGIGDEPPTPATGPASSSKAARHAAPRKRKGYEAFLTPALIAGIVTFLLLTAAAAVWVKVR